MNAIALRNDTRYPAETTEAMRLYNYTQLGIEPQAIY